MSARDDNDLLRAGELPTSPFADAVPILKNSEDAETTELTAAWPKPLSSDAYIGLAGDFVRLVEPHSESDPVALLFQFIICFGSNIGHSARYIVESTAHFMNEFLILVGLTSKGRKGTSLDRSTQVFEVDDSAWVKNCVVSGLNSGEGLIWQVRDPIERAAEGKTEIVDPGVDDKRLLVQESEFAGVLRVIAREGNTLSPVIRKAWDSGNMRSLTKNSPARATNAHVSIIGHITKEESNRYLDRTEVANGFGNRFLWACVKRSKCLPHGGALDPASLVPLQAGLKEAVSFARTAKELRRDDAANKLWAEVYPALSEGRPGLLGAVTGRAEAHVLRLSCLYALLDRTTTISERHLKAALAIWSYCEASARFIFGAALGNPIADNLLGELRRRDTEMSRTDIRDHLSGHGQKDEIDQALNLLRDHGLATVRWEETGGKPREWWKATATKATKATKVDSGAGEVA